MGRFASFVMFMSMIVTASSTFAIAVEVIFDWGMVWPAIQQAWANYVTLV